MTEGEAEDEVALVVEGGVEEVKVEGEDVTTAAGEEKTEEPAGRQKQ